MAQYASTPASTLSQRVSKSIGPSYATANTCLRRTPPERCVSGSSNQVGEAGLERLVGGRHVVEPELVGFHPQKLLVLLRGDVALPTFAEIKRHQQVELRICVAREGERHKIGSCDLDAKLLHELTDQRRLGIFARVDFAAREFPQSCERAPGRALCKQHF